MSRVRPLGRPPVAAKIWTLSVVRINHDSGHRRQLHTQTSGSCLDHSFLASDRFHERDLQLSGCGNPCHESLHRTANRRHCAFQSGAMNVCLPLGLDELVRLTCRVQIASCGGRGKKPENQGGREDLPDGAKWVARRYPSHLGDECDPRVPLGGPSPSDRMKAARISARQVVPARTRSKAVKPRVSAISP
jgi:hypothetical protein